MNKYLIAVGLPDIDTCLDEAKSLQKVLRARGINGTYTKRDAFDCVQFNTANGTVEFVSIKTLGNENFTVGKKYDKVFRIHSDCHIFIGRVKDSAFATDYLEWILKNEPDQSSAKFENLKIKCADCKNLPICAIKEEYFDIQTAIWDALNTSKHFKKIELSCEYFTPKDPIFACRHV